MSTVSKRELNQQTSRVLAAAETEGPVTVTERGVPRWRIEPVSVPSTPVDRLRAAGRLVPAKSEPAPWGEPECGVERTPADIDALLAELRGDAGA